jgi:hypothetical protein
VIDARCPGLNSTRRAAPNAGREFSATFSAGPAPVGPVRNREGAGGGLGCAPRVTDSPHSGTSDR